MIPAATISCSVSPQIRPPSLSLTGLFASLRTPLLYLWLPVAPRHLPPLVQLKCWKCDTLLCWRGPSEQLGWSHLNCLDCKLFPEKVQISDCVPSWSRKEQFEDIQSKSVLSKHTWANLFLASFQDASRIDFAKHMTTRELLMLQNLIDRAPVSSANMKTTYQEEAHKYWLEKNNNIGWLLNL